MPAKAKIDNEVFLELASKGLTQTEIARYFDVQPSSIRSKAMTLSKVHPDVLRLISTPTAEKQQNIDTRLSLTLDRYMLESSNVQKHLAKLPTEPSLDHLDQRSTIILKGLQILEKIQKISNPKAKTLPARSTSRTYQTSYHRLAQKTKTRKFLRVKHLQPGLAIF